MRPASRRPDRRNGGPGASHGDGSAANLRKRPRLTLMAMIMRRPRIARALILVLQAASGTFHIPNAIVHHQHPTVEARRLLQST